jgi:hypothetical protein
VGGELGVELVERFGEVALELALPLGRAELFETVEVAVISCSVVSVRGACR